MFWLVTLSAFAGDTNKYVVVTGVADASGGGTITLAAPGLRTGYRLNFCNCCNCCWFFCS
jgi:hypothetical protein